MLAVLLVVFLVLLVIGLSGQVTGYLQDAAAGRISVEGLWLLVALRLPEYAQLIVPFSLFLAVLLTFGRLHAEQEYVIYVMGGSSPTRMASWVVGVALPFALLVGTMSLYVTPWAKSSFFQLLLEEKVLSEFDAVVPGQFRKFAGGKRMTYVENTGEASGSLEGVYFFEQEPEVQSVLRAEHGIVTTNSGTPDRFLELNRGSLYEGAAGNPEYRVIDFDKVVVRLDIGLSPTAGEEPSALPLAVLDTDQSDERGEFHWRYALPLLTLLGALCAFSISRTRPRSGRYGQIFIGLLVFFGYYLLLLVGRKTVEQFDVQAMFGLWPVHLLALAAFLYFRMRLSRPR